MLRTKLSEIASETADALIDWLMCQLACLRELAFLNPRMTAKGAVSALVLLAAHFGFQVSASAQVEIATAVVLYLGIAGRDRPQRRLQ